MVVGLPDVIANDFGELVADTFPTVTPRPPTASKYVLVTTGTALTPGSGDCSDAARVMPLVAGVLVPAALLAVTWVLSCNGVLPVPMADIARAGGGTMPVPVRFAPAKLASVKVVGPAEELAPVTIAPERSAPSRRAAVRFAPLRFAAARFTWRRVAAVRAAPVRSAPMSFA